MINLCGQNGLINQVNDAQKLINEYIYIGKNAIGAIQGSIATIKNVLDTFQTDPSAILRTIQEDLLNVVSVEALQNPNSAIAKLLEIRNAYNSGGPAIERIISNVQAFINDPLNVPLDVCSDVPNFRNLGGSVVESVQGAKVPPPNESPRDLREEITARHEQIATIQATIAEEELKNRKEQTIPTVSIYALPDVGEDRKLAGRTPPDRVYNPRPGDAHAAAVYGATGAKPATTTNPLTGETRAAQTRPRTQTSPSRTLAVPPQPAPRQSIANPYPGGKQYIAADFAPSKYATSIAQKVNTLDPSVRGLFAAGIQDYIKTNFKDGRDVSIGEAYRSPERSAELAARFAAGTGGRAAPAGKSWHNYGAACDLCIFVNGKWDQGTRSDSEYTGRARASMQKYGLINDLSGDSGHFYVQSFGAGVPKGLQQGQTSVASIARSTGASRA